MSVRVTTHDGITGKAALYDSTSDLAFGPIFDNGDDAEAFLDHLSAIGERDARCIPSMQLAELKREWEQELEAKWEADARSVSLPDVGGLSISDPRLHTLREEGAQ
jgi:hypothetical protein